MGYQPTSQGHYKDDIDVIYKLKKEVEQLRYANDELVAEVHRLKQDGRLDIEANSPEQLARDREDAEDNLWHQQGKLRMEKAYAKGFATMTLLSTPATVALFWGASVMTGVMAAVAITFGIIFGLSAFISILVVLAKLFGAIPEAKRKIEKNQRALDRAVLKEMKL